MFKSKIFASELEMEEAIGDVDDMGTIINSGETVVDNYNNGDKSVKARLGGMMSSDVTVDGKSYKVLSSSVDGRDDIITIKLAMAPNRSPNT